MRTHYPTPGSSALEQRLRENLGQHHQDDSSGKATPVDLTFREPEIEQE